MNGERFDGRACRYLLGTNPFFIHMEGCRGQSWPWIWQATLWISHVYCTPVHVSPILYHVLDISPMNNGHISYYYLFQIKSGFCHVAVGYWGETCHTWGDGKVEKIRNIIYQGPPNSFPGRAVGLMFRKTSPYLYCMYWLPAPMQLDTRD